MWKEFREFAAKGNVIEMAVGIIIGAAFGKIVTSIVQNIITPILGILAGGIKFSHLKIVLKEAAEGSPEVAITYGVFLQATIDFIIVAFAIFFLVKGINRLKRKEQAALAKPPPPIAQEVLLTEIRDILKNK